MFHTFRRDLKSPEPPTMPACMCVRTCMRMHVCVRVRVWMSVSLAHVECYGCVSRVYNIRMHQMDIPGCFVCS